MADPAAIDAEIDRIRSLGIDDLRKLRGDDTTHALFAWEVEWIMSNFMLSS
jgi:hypothetical protein